MNAFSSAVYWEARYRAGGNSGAGSSGHLAAYKAAFLNGFIAANGVAGMIDLGCGDAAQLRLLEMPADYVGVDVSRAALARCAAAFPDRRFLTPADLTAVPPAELTVSLDVLYHLTEDDAFEDALRLFLWSTRFVVIYSSNVNLVWPARHVRHRAFTDRVAAAWPEWRLLAHLPNPWPYDPAQSEATSFADFFVFARPGTACVLPVPGADRAPSLPGQVAAAIVRRESPELTTDGRRLP